MRVARRLTRLIVAIGLLQAMVARAAAPDEAARLLGEAKALREAGKFAQALPLAERAVALREVGDPLLLAAVLEEEGLVRYFLGDLSKGERAARRALELTERALGPDHLRMATPLWVLGRILGETGQHERALPLLNRALRLRERHLGPEDPDLGPVLNTIGDSQIDIGDLDRAEHSLQRAIAILEKAQRPDLVLTLVRALNNMGNLLRFKGLVEEGVQYKLRALRLGEAALGPEHYVVVHVLVGLGFNYLLLGDWDRAEPILRRGLAGYERALPPTNWHIASALENLAIVSRARGEHRRSAALLERAVAIDALAENLPRRVTLLYNLGETYRRAGDLTRAEPLLHRALEISEKLRLSMRIAAVLTSLAMLYQTRGEHCRAEALYVRAIDLREDTPNPIVGDLPMALTSYVGLLLSQSREKEALPRLRRIFQLTEQRLRTEGKTLSEARLLGLLQGLQQNDELVYSFARRRSDDAEARRMALATALLRKGRALDAAAATSQALVRSLAPGDQDLYRQMRAQYAQLAALSMAGPGKLTAQDYRVRLQQLNSRADSIEQELAGRSQRIRAERQLPGPDDVVTRVAGRLPADGALIELVISRGIGAGTDHLLALVLRPDGQTAAVDLGEMAAIEGAAGRLLAALRDPRAPYAGPAEQMARLVMAPLRAHLQGRRQLYISTEGPLHFVPFAALADGYEFTYLTSGRDLLRTREARPAMTVAVLADPLFAQAAVAGPSNRATALRDRGLVLGNLAPLPGTRQEADAIRAMLPAARVLLGAEASEGALLDLKAPGILHVATHGIFVTEEAQPAASQRGFQATGATPTNPMLRSALVLAGAQAQQKAEGSDGLATALELSGMDLWGTQLVVLSACETGRGQARQGQGVYGLRRALSIAGAETLVTSLWKVDDATTKDLMTDYYRGLVSGQGRGDAMTSAMTKMRARKPHPYYWAPFIVIGQPGPLRGLHSPGNTVDIAR